MCSNTTSLVKEWFEEGLSLDCAINLSPTRLFWEYSTLFSSKEITRVVPWEKCAFLFSSFDFYLVSFTTSATFIELFICFAGIGCLGEAVSDTLLVGKTSSLGEKAYLKLELWSRRRLVLHIVVLRYPSLDFPLLSEGVCIYLYLRAGVEAAFTLDLLEV